MTNPIAITGHMIVKNEQQWIRQAIESVLDSIDKLIIFDTGSTDKTVSIIKSFSSPKIHFVQKGSVDRQGLVALRNEQIKLTKTPWFLLVDGDEVWPKANLIKLITAASQANPNTIGLVNKTRNCLSDISHYLPDSAGHYHIGPWQGHLNIRLIKNLPDLKVVGEYPKEAYMVNNLSLQAQPNKLIFVDTWYLHLTHLKRSSWLNQLKVIDRLKKFKLFGPKTLILKPEELPEVLR